MLTKRARQVSAPASSYSPITTLLILGALVVQLSQCIKLSVGVEHDLTGPTYGLEGKSQSQLRYDERQGLQLGGTLADLLGPPIKIANGLGNLVHGSNAAGLGASLRAGGALLGFDAKALEAAGAGNLAKGSALWTGLQAKQQLAGQVAGPKGQKIASIIEVPVKVVAMKDLASGKALGAMGQAKQVGAQAADTKGQALLQAGQALKSQGIQQIVGGVNEGVQNIGNMIQKTSENVNSAIRLLPIVWDMQAQQYAQEAAAAKGQHQQQIEQQPIQQQQQQHLLSTPHQLGASSHSGLTGGSLFGGLSSLFSPAIMTGSSGSTLGFGANGPNHGYAALWNATSPLTNLLMNPGVNPFLFPLAQGPLGQSIVAKQPIGTHESSGLPALSGFGGFGGLGHRNTGEQQNMSYNFNLIPGLKYSEHISASGFGGHKQAAQTVKGGEQIVQQQTTQRQTATKA